VCACACLCFVLVVSAVLLANKRLHFIFRTVLDRTQFTETVD